MAEATGQTEQTPEGFDVDSYVKTFTDVITAQAKAHELDLPTERVQLMAFDATEVCQKYNTGEALILAEALGRIALHVMLTSDEDTDE